MLFSFLRFASGFFCVSVVSSAATCYIIPPPSSDVNTYFWNFSNFLYFMFYIYFLYISDYFICIPVWPVEMFYIIGRFSFFYVLLSAKFLYKSIWFFRTFQSFSPVAFFLFGIWFSFYCYLFKKLFHRKPAKINVFTYSLFLIPYIKSIFFSNFRIAAISTHESTLYD